MIIKDMGISHDLWYTSNAAVQISHPCFVGQLKRSSFTAMIDYISTYYRIKVIVYAAVLNEAYISMVLIKKTDQICYYMLH